MECHGTGTALGDPIEAQALGTALSEGRSAKQPVRIGSVKSNIGHTQAAAGVAGIMKVVLAFEHDRIPKSLHAEELSPHIPWSELPLKVVTKEEAWPRGERPRLAGVSSFGISGTNAHVVLEEAPQPASTHGTPNRLAQLVVLSAKNEEALSAQAGRLRAHMEAHPELQLGDVAYSLATTRSEMEHRLAIAATSRQTLGEALEDVYKRQALCGAWKADAGAAGGRCHGLHLGL